MSRWLPVTVTSTSPLTVTFPDGSSLEAVGVPGLDYTATGSFIASHQDGALPVVVPASTAPTGTTGGGGTATLAAGTVLDGNA
jgi:hypothetical protein